MIQSLVVESRVGRSIIGSATFSPTFSSLDVGRCGPNVRTQEDAEALVRCGFLDPTLPSEVNVLKSGIRTKLSRLETLVPLNASWMHPRDLISRRASVAYVPAETLSHPIPEAASMLADTGEFGAHVSQARLAHPDGAFWETIAARGFYAPWVAELSRSADLFGTTLFAPPVPVIDKDLATSPDVQAAVNRAVAIQWDTLKGRRGKGLLYSLPLAPNALQSADMLQRTLLGMESVFSQGDLNFYGAHVQMTDWPGASRTAQRIGAMRDFVASASDITRRHGTFLMVSDPGPIGPIFLDAGASFTTFHPGMTPRKIKTSFGGGGDEDSKFGKTLGLWAYNLHSRDEVRGRGDIMEDTGLFPAGVPSTAMGDKAHRAYRVEFSKPQNTAVMERVNHERARELRNNGNARPGASHLGNSRDPAIAPWVA